MKSLSKSIKTIICFMAFLMAGVLFAISPITPTFLMSTNASGLTLLAVSSTVEKASCNFSAIHVPNTKVEITKGQQLLIPFLADQTDYTIRLIDKDGAVVHDYVVEGGTGLESNATGASSSQADFEVVEVDEGGTNVKYVTLKNKNSNTYTLVYIVRDGNAVYYSKGYELEVVGQDYVIDYALTTPKEGDTTKYLSTGKNQLYPTSKKVNTSFTFKAPYSHPKMEEGVVVEYTDDMLLTPVVTYNGSAKLVVGADDGMLTYNETTKEYTINFTKEGLFTIEYKDANANNTPTATHKISVSSKEDPTKEDIVKATPTLPSVQLGGTGYKFNKPTLKYKDGEVVSYNITSIKFYKKSNPKIYQLLENNNLKFDMTVEAFQTYSTEVSNLSYKDLVGAYNVVYELQDAYGNPYTYEPFNDTAWDYITVKDNPQVYMTYDYTAYDEDTYVADVDTTKLNAVTELKTTYGYGELIFPALYATDLVDKNEDLLVVRYITAENSTTYYLDNVRIENGKYVAVSNVSANYNHALTQEESDALWTGEGDAKTIDKQAYLTKIAKSAKFTFNDTDFLSADGTKFTLHYQVISKFNDGTRSGYLRDDSGDEYTFTVIKSVNANAADIGKLKINIEDTSLSNNKQVKAGQELTIKTVSSDEKDARLKNQLYYYTSVQEYSRPAQAEDNVDLTAGTTANLAADIEIVKQYIIDNRVGTIGNCNILEDPMFKTIMGRKYVGFDIVETKSNKFTASKTTTEFNLVIPSVVGSITLVPVVLNDNANITVGTTKQLYSVNTTEKDAPTVASVTYHTFTSEADAALAVKTDATWWAQSEANKVIGQNKPVYLPNVGFADTNDQKLSIDVQYYVVDPATDTEGENVDAVVAKNRLNGYMPVNCTIVNNTVYKGKIITNKVGTYYVVYTATDDAGNTTTVYYTFKVEATKKPSFTVALTGDEFEMSNNLISCEAGTVLHFEPSLKNANGQEIELSYVPTSEVGKAYIEYDIENNFHRYTGEDGGYKFIDAGKYSISITVTYNVSATETYTMSYTKTIDVSEPKLVWDEYSGMVEYVNVSSSTPVTLQNITASQKGYDVTVEVEVKHNSNTVEVNKVRVETADGGYEYVWQFYAKEPGKYTVTYKAVSTSGAKDSLPSFTIIAGDNAAPIIQPIVNRAVLEQDIVYDTDSDELIEYTIKLNNKSANKVLEIFAQYKDKVLYTWKSYNDDANKNSNSNLVIYEYDGSGVSSTNYSWSNLDVELETSSIVIKGDETTEDDGTIVKKYQIQGTGKVGLKLTIKDNNGNGSEEIINFNVVSELEPSKISDTKLGIILVVISVVILAGVILFFALTGKKGGSGKSKPSKKPEVEEKAETSNDNQ